MKEPELEICACCGQPVIHLPAAKYGKMLEAVGKAYGVTKDELLSHQRHRLLVEARAHCYWLLRKQGLSYPHIGRIMGGRDHSTIIYGVRKHNEMMSRLERGLDVPEVKRVGSTNP
jgi:chromosomal replication initiator protein